MRYFYFDKNEVKIGDIVDLGGSTGRVTLFLEPTDYPEEMCGVMIKFDKWGDILYKEVEEDVKFISRQDQATK